MSITPARQTPLRLWPGIAAAVLLVVIRFVIPVAMPGAAFFGVDLQLIAVMGAVLAAVAILVWWAFFSRAALSERVAAVILMVVALAGTRPLVHESMAGAGMGMLLYFQAIPVLSVALVAWAVASRGLSSRFRRVSLVATVLLACGLFTVVRTGGVTSDVIGSEFHWRWTPTPEEQLLAQARNEPPLVAPTPLPESPAPAENPAEPAVTSTTSEPETEREALATREPASTRVEWPGFRGPDRDSVVRGVRIDTDWTVSPPVELWRRPVGPGWSSLAVSGDLIYTQEQRGDDEVVACYRLSTGEPVWRHHDAVRFWESNGGAGPRATPTLSHGRVYSFGATGILNALDAATGQVIWSRNAATDTDQALPGWGFTSSPLVVNDVVIVAAAGTLAGYDVDTGASRWAGPSYGGSYSSPHLATIDDVEQVLLLGGPGAISVAPADGTVLWEHTWAPGAIVQPAVTPDGDILINTTTMTGGAGTRRLHVTQASGEWHVEERWTSNRLKPYFNDFVVHNGLALGFDGNILACIDLADGTRKWKGGRYGNGQLILLAEQDLLLVISEEGELALVKAADDQFTEVARFPALDGKTWNHPVLVGDVLLVRNGQEMAAFRLGVTS